MVSSGAAELFRLGVISQQNGDLRQAERNFRSAVDADAKHFAALRRLVLLLRARNAIDEADVLLAHAASTEGAAEEHAELGRVLADLGRHEAAVTQYSLALAQRPTDIAILADLARALHVLGRAEDAIPWMEKAIVADPGLAEAHYFLGALKIGVGKIEEARRSFESAIGLAPRTPRYYLGLADSGPYTPAQQAALEALEGEAFAADEQAALHVALARQRTDEGRHEEAFAHLRRANSIQRRRIVYGEARTLADIKALERVFTSDLLRSEAGSPSEAPVFVVGMPRSGTTLVEQILAGHPAAAGIGENLAFERVLLDRLAGAPYPAAVLSLPPGLPRDVGEAYLASFPHTGAARVVNKTPANFLYAGMIHLALPRARIIHVVRNAVDTCLSCFSLRFGAAFPYMCDLGEMGRYYRAYRGLMEHWSRVLPPEVYLEVRYEDVVDDLEREARRLVAHCGLDWDPSCLRFNEGGRPVWTASAAQIRKPLYKSKRWRPDAAALKPLLDGLGPYAAG